MTVPAKKAVDLAYEVLDLEDAIAAALLLVELGDHDQFEDERQAKRAVAGTAAVLRLIGYRLRHLGRVLRREEDPATLRSPSNEAVKGTNNVTLDPWIDRPPRPAARPSPLHRR